MKNFPQNHSDIPRNEHIYDLLHQHNPTRKLKITDIYPLPQIVSDTPFVVFDDCCFEKIFSSEVNLLFLLAEQNMMQGEENK